MLRKHAKIKQNFRIMNTNEIAKAFNKAKERKLIELIKGEFEGFVVKSDLSVFYQYGSL